MLLRVVADDDADGDSTSRSVEVEREGTELITELNADVVTALGEASERIGIFRDITARERREAELRKQNERLEQFAGTIAHDLRNPLSVAEGHLELARHSGDDEHLETISQAHDRMDQLIDEILTLARQGQVVMDPEPVSLEVVATEAWENVDTREASLSVTTATEIRADEGRLAECFENLFRNAVEHGGDAVFVQVGRLASDECVGFYVEDDGPGIPEADRSDVFEAGFTNAENGTGFGLSIVNQIVEGHSWEIHVSEGSESGARFEIRGVEGMS